MIPGISCTELLSGRISRKSRSLLPIMVTFLKEFYSTKSIFQPNFQIYYIKIENTVYYHVRSRMQYLDKKQSHEVLFAPINNFGRNHQ